MRFTDALYKDKDDYELCEAINIFSMKIRCSDVGFPIHVYVEGTIAIEVIQGNYDGQITAHNASTQNELVLYDRELYGSFTGDGKGVIQLMRPVVSVSVNDILVIVAKTRDGTCERTISFTPRVNGGEEDDIPVGHDKLRDKVTWSIMDF
ncbi:hypothetical protein PR202_gb22312 [Eleusine coracana subsp. coracana]|uniref:DUF6598 domain-containing protein n=1 Tax=Eleusine coracana subsp. coracana TaxID=191504 RepID=A0AAV5FHD9_ELECO|nr:hypothetical protein PR202_gb22312 [Eleusine coracana subsp. coracana]